MPASPRPYSQPPRWLVPPLPRLCSRPPRWLRLPRRDPVSRSGPGHATRGRFILRNTLQLKLRLPHQCGPKESLTRPRDFEARKPAASAATAASMRAQGVSDSTEGLNGWEACSSGCPCRTAAGPGVSDSTGGLSGSEACSSSCHCRINAGPRSLRLDRGTLRCRKAMQLQLPVPHKCGPKELRLNRAT